MQQSSNDRSLGELFSELTQQTSTLIRQEVALAKTEMTDKATKAGKDIGSLAAGGAIAYAGLLAIVAAVIILLAELGLPWWLSALAVGLVVSAAGYMMIQRGLTALKEENMKPERTIQTLRDDAEFAKRKAQ